MNKAFIREPDETASRCPRCESIGQPVGPQTLDAQLAHEIRRRLTETASFCPNDQCDVVYFDDFSGVVARTELKRLIPIKDPSAPICSCFGFKRDAIEEDLSEGTVVRTKAAILRAQSIESRCTTMAPNGRSCVSEIQSYFLKCKQRNNR